MRNLSDTIARLTAPKTMKARAAGTAVANRLSGLGPFGSNPGALQGRIYLNRRFAKRVMPLVVVLHGCTQSDEVAELLQTTLLEERSTDQALTKLAEAGDDNVKAAP